MPFDLTSVTEGLGALKTAFDGIRSAISIIKDVRSTGSNTEQEQKAIDTALTVASTNTAIAEATLGQAFGYQLCKCDFPPTPMRTVGYVDIRLANGMKEGEPVYECPKCGYNNAGPFTYKRIAPPRSSTS
jgi:hypothetical protein